jgi:cell division septation protein DedD
MDEDSQGSGAIAAGPNEFQPVEPQSDDPPPVTAPEPAQKSYKPKKSLKKATFNGSRTARAPSSFTSKSKPNGQRKDASAKPRQPSTRRGALTIQVAAVKSAGIANEMVAKLKGQGYDAHQSVAKIPGKGVRYRIRVGKFASSKEAQSLARRLKKDRYETIIVSR